MVRYYLLLDYLLKLRTFSLKKIFSPHLYIYPIEIILKDMKLQESSNLYTEFLLCQTSQASATMCSSMLDNIVKHDSFSRMLQLGSYGSHYVWNKAKSLLKSLKKSFKYLSLDNTIIHKPDSKVNELVNWFYDHSVGKAVKGINLISALIHTSTSDIPVGFEVQAKDQLVVNQDKHGNDRLVMLLIVIFSYKICAKK